MIRKMKTTSVILICLLMTGFALSASAETSLQIDDEIGDVFDYITEDAVERPNIDIEYVNVTIDNGDVSLEMKLAEGGTVQNIGSETLAFIYGFELITTALDEYTYTIVFGFDETANGGEGAITCSASVVDTSGSTIEDLPDAECDGVGTNYFTVTFDLLDSDERIISITGITTELDVSSSTIYLDSAPNEDEFVFLEPDAGDTYSGSIGDTITLSGDIEGNPDDYTWLWKFEELPIELDGQTASYTFTTPGIHEGILYVYDNNGNYGEDYFTVNITEGGSPDPGDDDDNESTPGFETLTLICALAIAFIIFKKRK